jgi:hypothetical protein
MTHGDARVGEMKGQQEKGVGIQHASQDRGAYSLSSTVQMLPADSHTSAASTRLSCRPPAESHGLVRCAERRNQVSAHVPSNPNCTLPLVSLNQLTNAHDYW